MCSDGSSSDWMRNHPLRCTRSRREGDRSHRVQGLLVFLEGERGVWEGKLGWSTTARLGVRWDAREGGRVGVGVGVVMGEVDDWEGIETRGGERD